MPTQPGFAVSQESGVTVVALDEPFDSINEAERDDIQELLLSACDQADPPMFLVDMSQVEFFGSSFIEVLFRVWNRINGRDGKFALSGLTKYCHEVLEITNLDKLWQLFDSRDDAIRMMQES